MTNDNLTSALTSAVKARARALGADLVGVAPVERYKNAPERMRPTAHLPSARSVLVLAIHHPDAAFELGGEPTPHDLGPYSIQYAMNTKLDYIAFWMAKFLEGNGFIAYPIPCSNVWRYRPYKELDGSFLPDLSHIHAATAAGLGQIGWSGLFLSPEYGPRQRLISIITDAPLEPTPMYDGPDLCDRCMLCVRNCPTQAFTKETNGVSRVQIEDKVFEYCNKNKWRCAWVEHFGINLELPIPDRVDEEAILSTLEKHGTRGGSFGQCARFCLPPHLRVKDPSYSRTYRRRRPEAPDLSSNPEAAKQLYDSIIAEAIRLGAKRAVIAHKSSLKARGIEVSNFLPDGQSAVVAEISYRNDSIGHGSLNSDPAGILRTVAGIRAQFIELDLARFLEKLGYSAVPRSGLPSGEAALAAGLAGQSTHGTPPNSPKEKRSVYAVVVTSAPGPEPGSMRLAGNAAAPVNNMPQGNIPATGQTEESRSNLHPGSRRLQLTHDMKNQLTRLGADLVGITTVERMEGLTRALRELLEPETLGTWVEDTCRRHGPVVPKTHRDMRYIMSPSDYLKEAASVIVFGIHYPSASLERAALPPAEGLGSYAYCQYETLNQLRYLLFDSITWLQDRGFQAVPTLDLSNVASFVANPRGPQLDATANAIAALAAGLGHIGRHGAVITPEYGVAQRFAAIITDAPLEPDPICDGEDPCEGCTSCLVVCPMKALGPGNEKMVELEGRQLRIAMPDRFKCDWSKRYALIGDEGPAMMGCKTQILPPEGEIGIEDIARALEKKDPIQKWFVCVAESCLATCQRRWAG